MSDPHREFCRRQHRIIGNYLAVEAWRRGLDCIVLVRDDLETFLGLERFKRKRNRWIMEDLKPWFRYQEAYYLVGANGSIHSLFLSRVPIKKHLPSGEMTTEARIAGLPPAAPRTARFSTKAGGKQVPSETKMISRLSVLAAGLEAPRAYRNRRHT